MMKRTVVLKVMGWTEEWNNEIHQAVEARVFAEYTKMFPTGASDREAMITNMRTFYYARMSTTATILIAVVAVLVSLISLLVSAVAVFH